MTDSPFFTVEQTAAHLHVSVRTIREWTRTGRVPHRKLPGQRRCLFIPSELEAWVNGAELHRTDLPDGGRIVKPQPPKGE